MGTTSFSVTRNDIINAALRAIGVLGLTQVPTANDYNYSSQALNLMIKEWQAKGANLWKILELTLPLVAGIRQYPIGPTAGYVLSIPVTGGGAGYNNTSTITLSAPPGFSGYAGTTATASLNITGGAVTSVSIVTPGAGYLTAPTITMGGAGAGATFGTPVIVGLTIERPLKLMADGNFIRVISSVEDTSILLLSNTEYNQYGSKTSSGIVNSIFY